MQPVLGSIYANFIIWFSWEKGLRREGLLWEPASICHSVCGQMLTSSELPLPLL